MWGRGEEGKALASAALLKHCLFVCTYYMSICLPAWLVSLPLYACLPVCLSACVLFMFVCFPICPPVCLSVYTMSVCPSACLISQPASVCLPTCLFVCLCPLFCLPVCPPVCLSAYLPPLPSPPTQLTSLNNGCSHGFSLRSLQLLQGSHSLQTSLRVLLQVPA